MLATIQFRSVVIPASYLNSPPSSCEVKNAWNYTSTPLIRLYGPVLT